MAKVRALALCAVLLLGGCRGSSAKPPDRHAVLRLALPLLPRTFDPARAADLPSLNVAHELYSGLTRFSGTGVEPDLAESWDVEQDGLVWTFHLREGIRWSNDAPITAHDFRRSWLRALSPPLRSAYARAEMQNIAGARRYRVTGTGAVGVEAVDERTLRVTLAHPVPWLDQQVAWPVFFPVPRSGSATSGPFRLASRGPRRLVLERNFDYWNVSAVKPRRLVLSTKTRGADAVLPRGVLAPGFPWIETGGARAGRSLPTLSLELLWLVTKGSPLSDPVLRQAVLGTVSRFPGGPEAFVPQAMPGRATIVRPALRTAVSSPRRLRLTLAYTRADARAPGLVAQLRDAFALDGIDLSLRPAATLGALLRMASDPVPSGVDLVLLGWSAEFFDAYNILDLFPCASAFNVARWCDRSYDLLMHEAVRTLDHEARWRLERQLVRKLEEGVPAVPLYAPQAHVRLKRGVGGFSWSPIGIYELMGMTRS